MASEDHTATIEPRVRLHRSNEKKSFPTFRSFFGYRSRILVVWFVTYGKLTARPIDLPFLSFAILVVLLWWLVICLAFNWRLILGKVNRYLVMYHYLFFKYSDNVWRSIVWKHCKWRTRIPVKTQIVLCGSGAGVDVYAIGAGADGRWTCSPLLDTAPGFICLLFLATILANKVLFCYLISLSSLVTFNSPRGSTYNLHTVHKFPVSPEEYKYKT